MKTLQQTVLLFVAAISISTVSRAIVDEDLDRRCKAQTTCTECIRKSPDCGWCSGMIDTDEKRCNAIDRESPNPGASCPVPLEDPFSELVGTSADMFDDLTQVIPRRATLRVRPGSPVTFEVQVKPANNFPIDLYLLMDLSFSMNDDLTNLKSLGTQLAARVANLSSNFTLGFGSFDDKPLGSFVNLDPRRLQDPCGAGCIPPYSYRHVVSLTTDDALFSDKVNLQEISGNQDFPEGGFDGLLQSIVCTEFIGWRPVSRKILLYMSDAGFHFAGDGLLGGVVKPNDGMCHMMDDDVTSNEDGTIDYTSWAKLDYPSIGQIAEKLDQFDIISIFAVTEGFQELYQLLTTELGNRAYLTELTTDSSNVVDLVEQLYNEISRRVVFSQVNIPGVSITVSIDDCPPPAEVVGGVCSNVQSGETVRFSVSVGVTQCTEELQAGPIEIELRVVGFGLIIVDLTAICECDCNAFEEPNSPTCNNNGTLMCGICECNPGYFGDRCQCDNTGTAVGVVIECPSGLDGLMCSGRGTCTCGTCECHTDRNGEERFHGIACECDIMVCELGIGNMICSGPSRGECTCDGCQCLPEPVTGFPYTRSDCSCTLNIQTCVDPTYATDICNGRGICECGECICQDPYFGEFCDLCSGDEVCQLRTCIADGDNAHYALCVIDRLEELNNRGVGMELFTEEGLFEAILNGTLPINSNLTYVKSGDLQFDAILLPESFSFECSIDVNVTFPALYIVNDTMDLLEYDIEGILSTRCSLGLDCIYLYYVAINEVNELLPIHVGYPPACPVQSGSSSGFNLDIPAWAIALIVIALVLLIGIMALILLKVLLVILDFIEVRKFEKELKKIKNGNPLSHRLTEKHVIATSHNPAYDMVECLRTEEAEGNGVSEGREIATGTVSHTITMQSNPVYNAITSDTQEPEYDYII